MRSPPTLAALALLALAACAAPRPNPEHRACRTACVEKKNACMIAATAADAVGRCDAEQAACMQPCLAMPQYVR